ncbi:MAG TPA: hypothetical protein VFK85_15990 [Anaeromyxobacteraceae bacterium]|nr:hypothetical protein [Anaeromyxobacteraceae bacterium]
MTGALVLSVLLALQASSGVAARAQAVRQELADVAVRIERMKAAGVRGGPQIEALLARSQGLAAELERLERLEGRSRPAEPVARGEDPQELRERADALRDEVDKLHAALADVDRRLREEGRRRRAGRLATMEEEGALFAESSPGRVGSARPSGGASGAEAPTGPTAPAGPAGPTGPTGPVVPVVPGPTGPSGAGGPSSPPTGPVDGGSAAPVPDSGTPPATRLGFGSDVHVWSSPAESRSWNERLAPGRGDGAPELKRKREAIVGAISEAEARIQRMEAEARELDARP